MNTGNDQVRRRNVDLVRHAKAVVEVSRTRSPVPAERSTDTGECGATVIRRCGRLPG
jgi:hypothetical protein